MTANPSSNFIQMTETKRTGTKLEVPCPDVALIKGPTSNMIWVIERNDDAADAAGFSIGSKSKRKNQRVKKSRHEDDAKLKRVD